MMTMNNILPHDLVVNILSRLPVKSLLRFRCVSKPWKIFFSDPSFIQMHLNHSINNYEHLMFGSSSSCLYSIVDNNKSSSSSFANEIVEIDFPFKSYPYYGFLILGSCNGLILMTNYKGIYCIWNPSTKEFKKLPDTPLVRQTEYGFGYDKITQDYKVVRIVTLNDSSSEVKVYTLGSNSWRRIQDLPDTLELAYALTPGKLVNGVLHWVATRLITTCNGENILDDYDDDVDDEDEDEDEEEKGSYIILSLNIEDEKYGEIQQPDFTDTRFQKNVEVLGGCLCIMCNFHNIRSEIWVMKDYGVKESWTKLFIIAQPTVIQSFDYVRPLKFTKNGEVVFEKDNDSLFVYDPEHGLARTLQIRGLKEWFEAETYVESLISLNSGTFVGQEQAV